MGFSSLLLSDLFQVLDQLALSDLVEDSDNGGVLGDGGDGIVARSTHFLDVLALVSVDSVEFCHINLTAGDVLEELGLGVLVGIRNLLVNLLARFVVDGVESLLLSRGVGKLEASIALLNVLNELSEAETGGLRLSIDINATFSMSLSGARLPVILEVLDKAIKTFFFVEGRNGGELGDACEDVLWVRVGQRGDIEGKGCCNEASGGKDFHYALLKGFLVTLYC